MKSDVEIAREHSALPLEEIADRAGLKPEDLCFYGKNKAKISYEAIKRTSAMPEGKMVLVTAITPTPAGEGKTTVSIGLADGLNLKGVRTMLALREPSLGPVFGVKGGATGGGYAQVIPDGGNQPALYRRPARHRRGKQSVGRHGGQPYFSREREKDSAGDMEALCGYERPPAEKYSKTAWAAAKTACPARTGLILPPPAK